MHQHPKHSPLQGTSITYMEDTLERSRGLEQPSHASIAINVVSWFSLRVEQSCYTLVEVHCLPEHLGQGPQSTKCSLLSSFLFR